MMRKRYGNWFLVIGMMMIFTSIVSCCVSIKAQEITENISDESYAKETVGEKQLVQYANDWTVFWYLNSETGKPMFDIRYMDKTIEELTEENLFLEYRFYYKYKYKSSFHYAMNWYKDTDEVSQELIEAIESEKDNYYIQFRIIDETNTELTKSYTLLLWQEQNFPYVLTSNVDYCEYYDLRTESNTISVEVLYSEPMERIGAWYVHVDFSEAASPFDLIGEYSVANYDYVNVTSNVEIGGEIYSIENCRITFDLVLPKECVLHDYKNYDEKEYKTYLVDVGGMQGKYSNQIPTTFVLSTIMPVIPEDEIVQVESITITGTNDTMYTTDGNDYAILTANVMPENATQKDVTWFSSNENVACVYGGIVSGISRGTAVITAVAKNGVKGEFVITVIDPSFVPVTSISIFSPVSKLGVFAQINLTETIVPENATDKSISWISSNPECATVSSGGTVTAKKAGCVTITAIANGADGDRIQDEIVLEISEPQNATIDIQSKKIFRIYAPDNRMAVGQTMALKAEEIITLSGSSGIGTIVEADWRSSDEKCAVIDENGIVTAKQAGNVTITAVSKRDNSKTASCQITIIEPVIPVMTISVSSTENTVAVGGKLALSAVVSPENATNKSIIWTSSNEKYATVDANGTVTAKAAGAGKAVVVTAQAMDGSNVKASFSIKIKKIPVKKIKISGKKTIKAGKKIALKAKITPANATNKK